MAKLYEPGSQELFQSLKGIIDFYYYKGQLCARSMPQHCAQPGTAAQRITWDAFKWSWSATRYATPNDVKAWKLCVKGSALTWTDGLRKSFMTGYNFLKGLPPFIYDVVSGWGPGGYRVGYRAVSQCQIRLYYTLTKGREYSSMWGWNYNTLTQTPPNCRKKMDMWEKWKTEKVKLYLTPFARQWIRIGLLPYGFRPVYTLHSQVVPMVVSRIDYRTGVYDT